MDLLRKIAFPFSLIYATVVHVRNLLYDIGILESKTFNTPTICVGNLSVGGTGKTPMVEYLIRCLSKNRKVAVLSRGYKRESSGFILATASSEVEELGDEPYQIHSKFPGIHLAVDADRRNGIVRLEEMVEPDVILLDDAFQHRRVMATCNILLTSYTNLYCNDLYLPTGNLRDSKGQARRADIIVVTKCPQRLSESEQLAITEKLRPESHQLVLFACLSYEDVLLGDNGSTPLSSLKDKNITVVTGIADPDPLIDYLHTKALSFEHLKFKDHHSFTSKEVENLNRKEVVLTTEKDYVRLKGKVVNLYYIGVEHSFLNEGGDVLERKLLQSIKQSP